MPGYLPPGHFLAASGLPQIQQHTDPGSKPDPGGDELPEGVAFPLGDNAPGSTFAQQWSTGPDGPQPRTAAAMDPGMAEAMAQSDVSNSRPARHQSEFGSNPIQHGRYLRAWNNMAGLVHGLTGRSALSKEDYGDQTGRPDLHSQYLAAYAQGYSQNHRADAGGQATASLHTADAWSQPRQTTDDFDPPFNSAQTTPDPVSSNEGGGDFQAGMSAGQSDRRSGEHPLFADNSSGTSPYVKGYAQGYGAAQAPAAPQDVPAAMGGDSGQGQNAGEAQRAFQVARASRTASLRRVSAVFAPDELMGDPEFRKGYLFASKWQPGRRLVAQGSAKFEAGLYAGITDRPGVQDTWTSAHAAQGARHRELTRRIGLHQSFTGKMLGSYGHPPMRYLRHEAIKTRRYKEGDVECWKCGDYLREDDADKGPAWAPVSGVPYQHRSGDQAACDRAKNMTSGELKEWKKQQRTAATSTDLITDGPGTSPDPMGATPLNGPGTPPPMGGLSDPAASGGAPPYQGTAPLPGGPVVPDDVMGRPQEQPQPSGPFTQTFSGTHPENASLAPSAPDQADQSGYTNQAASQGDPHQPPRMAAFRNRVQAGLAQMGAQ